MKSNCFSFAIYISGKNTKTETGCEQTQDGIADGKWDLGAKDQILTSLSDSHLIDPHVMLGITFHPCSRCQYS